MIGLNFKDKGGYELLKAFQKVKIDFPKSKLVIVGDRANLNMEGVIFRGVLDNKGIKKELEDANLYIQPSHKEAFGIALVEAMAFYTPCIGMDIEAMPEIIDDNETGFIIKPGDIETMIKKMQIILGSPSCARAMGCNGHKKYTNEFHWDQLMAV